MSSTKQKTEPIAAIITPSADLINFRFDQNDKQLSDLKTQNTAQFQTLSDKIDTFTSTFVSQAEINELRNASDQTHRALWEAVNEIKKSTKWWVTTAITIAGILAVLAGSFLKH